MKNSQRLQIISDQEVLAIYGRPLFSNAERIHYFSLTNIELNLIKLRVTNGKDTSSKLYFILQLGYFKAKHLFFQFNYAELEEDAKFILNTYMPNDLIPSKLPSRTFQSNTHLNILSLTGFRDNAVETNELLLKKSNFIVQKIVNPNKTILPPYSRLQDIIGAALKNEEARIIKILQNELTIPTEQAIKELLEIEDVFYKITELQFDAKTFRTQEMQLELSKLEACRINYVIWK